MDGSDEEKLKFFRATYNEIIEAVFRLTKSLDLSLSDTHDQAEKENTGDQNISASNPSEISNLQANFPKDYSILVNLTEFSKLFLKIHNLYGLMEKKT